MTHDERSCPHQQKKQLVVELWRAEQEGCLTLAEEDWWKTMAAIGSLEQSKADLEKCVQNWNHTARDNDQAMRAWRRCSVALGGVMCAIEGLRLWGMIW